MLDTIHTMSLRTATGTCSAGSEPEPEPEISDIESDGFPSDISCNDIRNFK